MMKPKLCQLYATLWIACGICEKTDEKAAGVKVFKICYKAVDTLFGKEIINHGLLSNSRSFPWQGNK